MTTKKSSKNAIMGEAKNLALMGGGVILGALAGKFVDKILKVDQTTVGFSAKKLGKPAVQLGLGILGTMKLKDQNLKMLASGVGISGIVSAANIAMNRNLLDGIPGLGYSSPIYQEPMQLSVGTYNPDLPQLYAGSPNQVTENDFGYTQPLSQVVDSNFEII